HLPTSILTRYGIRVERDYREILRLPSLKTYQPEHYEQILLAPIPSSSAEEECRAHRAYPQAASRAGQTSADQRLENGTP
ncbi:MAG: hypothetical protein KDI19_12055, partial [Pseudomonadales bacterium]|nr:hypothetical protein [Pseudomonadales bacterium]